VAYLVVTWVLTALIFLGIAHFITGFRVAGFGTALVAAAVFGLVNSTLGMLLKLVTLPLTLITFGLFLIVINALMLLLASAVVPGFDVTGFGPAFVGAIVLAAVNTVVRHLIFR
jgi:putative membrane protein